MTGLRVSLLALGVAVAASALFPGCSSDAVTFDETMGPPPAEGAGGEGDDGAAGGETTGAGGSGGEGVWTPPDGDPIEAEALTWTFIEFPESRCRDGSSTGIGVSLNPESNRVMIFLEGGGACFNRLTCAANPSSFDSEDFDGFDGGLFDRDNEDNPVADYNFVYVPYCTGDVHAGDNPAGVVEGLGEQMFVGYANMRLYLDRVVPTFLEADKVLLTGISAGGFGAFATADLVQRTFGPTEVVVLDDSGPPMRPPALASCLQEEWRTLWGLDNTVLADCGANCQDSSDFLVDFALHLTDTYPNNHFGLFSRRADSVIRTFYGAGRNECAGGLTPISEDDFTDGLDGFRTEVEGRNFGTYYQNGSQHTVLRSDGLYRTEVGEVPLTTWIADLLEGRTSNVSP
ncbi:MAG: pectin acetylesterase-family hydrolase [Myxococcota bacterium]